MDFSLCTYRRQQWALLRRYGQVIMLSPIRSLIRILLWPGLLIGLVIYLLSRTEPDDRGTTIFHAYSIGEWLIKDKATGMKSLMISMGLRRLQYYCACSICLAIFILPISLTVGILLKYYLLDQSVDYITIICVFTLFALHLDGAISFLVSFISSQSFSFIILISIFLESGLHTLAKLLVSKLGTWKSAILFICSLSPYEPIRLFINNYLEKHPLETNTSNPIVLAELSSTPEQQILTQSLSLLILSQIFWFIFFKLFAMWFEEVCPWQTVSAVRDLCFCIRNERNRYAPISDTEDQSTIGNKYFERREQHREIGIKLNGLSKSYANSPAVADVSFTIYKGETTLLLGHNGAGKSTLMNMILGLLEPTSGKVRIKARSDGAHKSVGVCPQTSVLDDDLTVRQHLELFNDIKSSLSGADRSRHIQQTIDDVSLTPHVNKRPSELSGGMRRKLSLGMAFVGKSEVLILDEPSSGLDPDSRMFVWNAIRRYRADRTVLLSTQHMEEADYLGDRIAIMSAGQIVCCGSSVFLNKLFGTGYKLRIECRSSKRKKIHDYVRSYFDLAQANEESESSRRSTQSDPVVDFVVELKTNQHNKDPELELIKLLEDLENNSQKLNIISFGLKSSSIEDVMLNTSKYFGSNDTKENTRLTAKSGHIVALADSKNKLGSYQAFTSFIYALLVKIYQMFRANWFYVSIMRILMPLVACHSAVVNTMNSTGDIFWHNVVFVLMIGQFVYFPARERISKFKIVQLDSNLSTRDYWLAFIIVDLASTMFCIIALNIFISTSLRMEVQVSMTELHLIVSGGTLLFCLASMMFCYLLSHVFTEAKSAYGYTILVYSLGFLVAVITYLFRLAVLNQKYKPLQNFIEYSFAAILPGDAYSLFFHGLANRCYYKNKILPCEPEDGISDISTAILMMLAQIICYTLVLILIEMQKFNLDWYCTFRNVCCLFNRSTKRPTDQREIDHDVVEETTKALALINDQNNNIRSVVAARLNKSYVRGVPVIENLSFTVNKGECFGLLGVNGAGKSTTFSMLASECCPDSGRLLAKGFYQDTQLKNYRDQFGYDPQTSPDLSLTPIQALSLMAKLRGIFPSSIPMLVKSVLELLDMIQHSHKLDSELSGGTKRKLALGMALIGNPAIMALDEPTAGVDPLARRSVWQLLKSLRTQNNASIIISSHAMEECEAICDRITIMARGRLRCIGTFLHLRSKFAKGCTLRVQFINTSSSVDSINQRINGSAGRRPSAELTDRMVHELQDLLIVAIGVNSIKLADRNVTSVTFDIIDNRVRRSILFKTMRDFRNKYSNVSYIVNDASLEDIFIQLAKEQQDIEQREDSIRRAQQV